MPLEAQTDATLTLSSERHLAETRPLRPPGRRRLDPVAILVTLAIAAGTFWLAYDEGSYRIPSWTTDAMLVWWLVLLVVVAGVPLRSMPASAGATLVLLAALAALSGLSGFWASGAETPFLVLNRTLFYVGASVLVVLTVRQRQLARWVDGIGLGLSAVAFVALASRFFPRAFAEDAAARFLPDAHTRLSFPVGYWNGLAILVALACPLLLCAATAERHGPWAFLALAPIPAIVTTVYLASSRTGVIVAVVGSAAFIVLSSRRWAAVGAALVAGAYSVGAVVYVASQHELVAGPLRSGAAVAEGRRSAAVVVAAGLGASATFALVSRAVRGLRVPSALGWAATALFAAILLGGVLAASPVRRWHEFTAAPGVSNGPQYIQNHLLSANGNWRWQFWRASWHEFTQNPLLGRGAGSFEEWWAQHGIAIGFVANPHSLYFETLGDLGLAGIAFLGTAFVLGAVGGVRAALRAPAPVRDAAAAAVAGFIAFAVGAGIDWMWELPVVSVTGFVLLGLPFAAEADNPPSQRRYSARQVTLAFVIGALAIASVVAEGDLYEANAKVADSQRATAAGHLDAARRDARLAQSIEPWAATPYLQLALVEETAGRLAPARRAIEQALAREDRDWRLWLIAARIETKQGAISVARVSFNRARELNPRSPVFSTG